MDYKHILLATDLSNHSEQVARRAREMVDKNNANLSMIYVMEHSPVAYGGEYSIPIDANLEASLEKEAKSSMAKLGAQFNIAVDQQYLGHGSVKIAVIDQATEIGADLIIVGTHGHHGLAIILGSRANAITNHAQCDVLVVRVGTTD